MSVQSAFDPRAAALNHGGAARAIRNTSGATDLSDFASAIACGLVYVGDQLAVTNNHLSAVVGLLEQLDATVNNRLVDLTEAV
jgi:hypothetical protein